MIGDSIECIVNFCKGVFVAMCSSAISLVCAIGWLVCVPLAFVVDSIKKVFSSSSHVDDLKNVTVSQGVDSAVAPS